MFFIDLFSQELDCVLVGYILDHKGCPSIKIDPISIDLEVEWIELTQPLTIIIVRKIDREVRGRCKGIVLTYTTRHPYLTLPLLLALTSTLLHTGLLHLLPRATNPPRLDLLQDLIRDLTGDIWRALLSRRAVSR